MTLKLGLFLPSTTVVTERLCFTPVCQSFTSKGGHVWQGDAWQGRRWACMAGRACMVGGGCVGGGHAWQRGPCMAEGDMHGREACVAGSMHDRGHAWQERQPLQRTVRILQESILV